jgi:hypothetical protein
MCTTNLELRDESITGSGLTRLRLNPFSITLVSEVVYPGLIHQHIDCILDLLYPGLV